MNEWAALAIVGVMLGLLGWLQVIRDRRRTAKNAARRAAKRVAEAEWTTAAVWQQAVAPIPPQASAHKAEQADEVSVLRRELSLTRARAEAAAAEITRLSAIVQQQAGQIEQLNEVVKAAPSIEDGSQFRRLRALIVKELHPDYAAADSVDRAIRSEVFKAIWPKIEAITHVV